MLTAAFPLAGTEALSAAHVWDKLQYYEAVTRPILEYQFCLHYWQEVREMAVALRLLLTGLVAALFLPSFWILASAWVFSPDLRKAANFSSVGVIESAFLKAVYWHCLSHRGVHCNHNFHVAFGPWYVTALHPPSSAGRGIFTLTQVTLENGEHPSTGQSRLFGETIWVLPGNFALLQTIGCCWS